MAAGVALERYARKAVGGMTQTRHKKASATPLEKYLADDPPNDPAAERALLGALITLPSEFENAVIRRDDFFNQDYARLFDCMVDLRREGKPIDVALLVPRLNAKFSGLNWGALVAELITEHPIGTHAKHYAAAVHDKAIRRHLFEWSRTNIEHAANGVSTADLVTHAQTIADVIHQESAVNKQQFEWRTSAELAASNEQVEYIVDNVVTAAQGGLVSGVFKTLKTAVACDLFISAATGKHFLNHFPVKRAVPWGFMSAEIGWHGLRERAEQVARSKGFKLADVSNLHWSTGCPIVSHLDHLDALERFIVDRKLKMLGIDPSYLAFSTVGDKASNVFSMGGVLLGLTRLIDQTGCTILIVNHNRKHRGEGIGRFDEPQLSEISMSGFAEWARFWILLAARQEWNEETGEHWLHIRTGGSAGHAGLHHLDVLEGKRTDEGGRRWLVNVMPTAEGRKQADERKEQAAEAKRMEQVDRTKEKIVRAMAKYPNGETERTIRDTAGVDGKLARAAFAELLSDEDIAPCEVSKGNRRTPYQGYRLTDRGEK